VSVVAKTAPGPALEDSRIKVFLSYSWTSYDHQQWVIGLAKDLMAHNVHPVIDAWDLRTGDDSIRFMERMVNDKTVTKVLILSDKKYAERANDREGGVGTETQIISPELYDRAESRKFALGVCERDEKGKPYMPTYYKGRIYIDFSDESKYVDEFEKLLRWIHDQHAEERPTEYGSSPSFLQDKASIDLGTGMYARRATEAFRTGKAQALGSFIEYLDTLATHLDRLKIKSEQGKEFDDQVVGSFEAFRPYRDEFVEVIGVAMRHSKEAAVGEALHHFFERIFVYNERAQDSMGSYRTTDFDNFRLICRELFLLTNTLALKLQRFDLAHALLNREYYLPVISGGTMYSYGVLARPVESMDYRRQRLQSRRANLVADLLLDRTDGAPLSREDVMQADFFLYLKSDLKNDHRWHPATHVFAGGMHRPFEIFARAGSKSYWDQLAPLLGVDGLEKFKVLMAGKRDYGDDFNTSSFALLTNVEELGTRP
jgi:hypothetical protein